ncbi:lipoprotein [Streptomyces paromomycinus]|uniref:Lipoprotein n=1 Tax=Streptomyces paromomycinus TaxID=92743 RepID=A0A401W768_STREY|nr:lipoprotein [Streptomyces paromomycinus]
MRRRTLTAVALTVVPLPLALAAGCAPVAGLHDDGRARDVKAPLALWADRTPAPRVRDEDPGDQRAVPGIARVPSGSMKDTDPAAVVRADIASDGDRPPAPGAVRSPVLHDLTDDGKPDLISAVDLDARTSLLRVYSVRDQVVTRVLAMRAVLAGVELAAGHLAVREPTKDPRYVSVTDYVWDGRRMGLWDLTLDEYRTPQNPLPTAPSNAPSPGAPA